MASVLEKLHRGSGVLGGKGKTQASGEKQEGTPMPREVTEPEGSQADPVKDSKLVP